MQGKRSSERTALLIDGLGTLVALDAPAPLLRGELARRFEIEVSDAQAHRALAAEIAFYRVRMGDGRDADSLLALRRECADVLRDALPASDRLARVDTDSLTGALLASLRFTAFDDAREALLAARAAGQRVVVVSNWDVSLAEVLERVGLAPLLHGVVTSAAIGARKPSPAIFEHALALAGTVPAQAVHVGDSIEDDVEGARACGIAAVLLRRDGEPGPAGVATIASLAQLTCAY
jgi:putative hydrolase of the HAD superfamily